MFIRSFIIIMSIFLISSFNLNAFSSDDNGSTVPRVVDYHRSMLEGELDDVMVVAHRACWRLAPENSILAIKECTRIGVDMVEIDVRRTKDGHLVIFHDAGVERTTNGKGLISELTLAELSTLRLKEGLGGESAKLTEHTIPTLEQALLAAKDKILVNLDAKADVRDESYLTAKKLNVTDQILMKMKLFSFDKSELPKNKFFNNTSFMPIIKEENGEMKSQLSSYKDIDAVAYELIYQSEKQLKEACHQANVQGARCWVNTMWEILSPGHSDEISVLDPDKHWGHLVTLGVNMFQTDRPEELIKYLQSKKLRSL